MMEQVADWLARVPNSVWSGLIMSAIVAGLARLAKRPQAPDPDGWTRLRPTALLLVLRGLSIIMILFAFLLWLIAIVILQDGSGAPFDWGVLIFAPLVVGMFGRSALHTFFCRQHFNGDGFEQRFLGRRRFIRWADIAAVRRHWLLGPRLYPRSGAAFQLSEARRGFSELVDQAAKRDVTIEL